MQAVCDDLAGKVRLNTLLRTNPTADSNSPGAYLQPGGACSLPVTSHF